MKTEKAYNLWAKTYDSVENPTRDLDKLATEKVLGNLNINFKTVLELGCGTGKNTPYLCELGKQVLAVDFSEKMLEKAAAKVKNPNVEFQQADLLRPWDFVKEPFELVTSCLVMEHFKDLHAVFAAAKKALIRGGYFYLCELHPIKQYLGSKARFEVDGEINFLESFVHHTSDYFAAAKANDFDFVALEEWFDEGDSDIPRLISLVFRVKPIMSLRF